MNQESEIRDLAQKREREQLQADEKIKKKDEEIIKLRSMLQNLEIKLKNERTVEEKEEESIHLVSQETEKTKMENDPKKFLINILAPPRQVTDLHGKVIQGRYVRYCTDFCHK